MSGVRVRTVDVVLTADRVAADRLGGVTALVIDVLRASTTMITALGHGAACILPVADLDEARRRAADLGAGALLAGERGGDPPPGFDLGNSPLEFTRERVAGRTIVMTTSNGTRALGAARGAAAVAVAAFVNAAAATAWAERQDGDIVLICSGELGQPALEDSVCAGLLAGRLARDLPDAVLTPAAEEARTLAEGYAKDVTRLGQDAPHARSLERNGRAEDIAACLTLDASEVVPTRLPGVDKLVWGPR